MPQRREVWIYRIYSDGSRRLHYHYDLALPLDRTRFRVRYVGLSFLVWTRRQWNKFRGN